MVAKRGKLKKRARIHRKGKEVDPRFLAVKVLAEWLSREPGKRGELDMLANKAIYAAGLSPRDLALFWQLVMGTTRWLRLLRWHLERYLRRFTGLPLPVQVVLLVGAYQILFLSKIPFFSAVNESVKLVKRLGASWASGLVNASLRRLTTGKKYIVTTPDEIEASCQGKRLDNCLSNLTSHPHWMVKRWMAQFGERTSISICLNNNQYPGLTLRVNTLRVSVEEFLQLLSSSGVQAKPGELSPFAVKLQGQGIRVEDIPGFERGLFQVQDESSQLATLLLDPAPGLKILDACAGIGGKATFLSQLIREDGVVVASDINKARLEKLAENLERLGLRSIETYAMPDEEEMIKGKGPFDRILIDAPCSGLGVIRRHPDIKWNRLPGMIEELSRIQIQLLEKWAPLLRPGGKMVYCVCTMETEETMGVVSAFLDKNPGVSLLDARSQLPYLPDQILDGKFLRILPGQLDMDGFFAAVFKRVDQKG